MSQEIVIIGAGGHGRVISDIIEKYGDKVYGYLDDGNVKECGKYPVLGKVELADKLFDKKFIIAVGNNITRKNIYKKYPHLNYYTAIHPDAVIANDAKIGAGTCVMASAVINANAVIGNQCIINTASVVEHDNCISDYVHISPHATLCGTVNVGALTHIGAGAIIINNTSVCDGCVIGAGAVVTNNINVSGVYVGVPAKQIK